MSILKELAKADNVIFNCKNNKQYQIAKNYCDLIKKKYNNIDVDRHLKSSLRSKEKYLGINKDV